MIAYRVEIWCDGERCYERCGKGIAHDDPESLPGLGRNLEEIAKGKGWSVDGAAHFCPACQMQRNEKIPA